MEEETKERLMLMNLEGKLFLAGRRQVGGEARGQDQGQGVPQGIGRDPDPDRGHDNDFITAQKTVRGNMINLIVTRGT